MNKTTILLILLSVLTIFIAGCQIEKCPSCCDQLEENILKYDNAQQINAEKLLNDCSQACSEEIAENVCNIELQNIPIEYRSESVSHTSTQNFLDMLKDDQDSNTIDLNYLEEKTLFFNNFELINQKEYNFIIFQDEINQIDNSILSFTISPCEISALLTLKIQINNNELNIINPHCGGHYELNVDSNLLTSGKNNIQLISDIHTFTLNEIKLKLQPKEQEEFTYKFDLDNSIFQEIIDSEYCGKIDRICPKGCSEDVDKDCCFKESRENFWCDIPTNNQEDRCAGSISLAKCSRCESGYEDMLGNIANVCQGLCGDDSDGICPHNCDLSLDKDCCFEISGTQYWCNDFPRTNSLETCKFKLNPSDCNTCQNGYVSEDNTLPKFCTDIDMFRIIPGFEVILKIDFQNDNQKLADLIINDELIKLDTKETSFETTINEYVQPGFNQVTIIPKSNIQIQSIDFEIKS
ncbi:hypothetical protein ACFL1H_01160 [Nanoarchaeota archaeon]